MEDKAGVNRILRQRRYDARDKEEIMNKAKQLHKQGYSQVKIAEILGVNRSTLARWNKEWEMYKIRKPGEAGKLVTVKLERKYNKFSSLMIESDL